MKLLVRRILVPSADLRERSRLVSGVYTFYEILANGLAAEEISAECRQVGEVALLEGSLRDNGFRSYLDRHHWRPQAAADMIAAFVAIGALEQSEIVSAIAGRLGDLTAAQMRDVRYGSPQQRSAQPAAMGGLNEWLDEQESLLFSSLAEKVEAIVERSRTKGVIKAASERQVESEIDRILAQSPTRQAKLNAIAEREIRDRPYAQRRHQAIEELARVAGLSIYLNSYRLAENELPWAPRCWVLSLQTAEGRPDIERHRVCYFEDGDKGVLARHDDGVRLAEITIDPGSTDFVERD